MEVTCSPNVHDPGCLWNIEDNVFPKRKFLFFKQGNGETLLEGREANFCLVLV